MVSHAGQKGRFGWGMTLGLCLAVFSILTPTGGECSAGPPRVELAAGGRACMPVVIADGAAQTVRQAAGELAEYLGKISGAYFAVEVGDGVGGIAVGLAGDFASAGLEDRLTVEEIGDRERYVLRSHEGGLYVMGATELAVSHAVWDLLWRLGYRQFFPNAAWEVVPRMDTVAIAIDIAERPAYLNRRIWYGFGTWDYNAEPYQRWGLRNRTASAFELNISHAYEGIIRANKTAFDGHPEYLGLIEGERKSSKICIGNPSLRKLVVDYAIECFKRDPARDSISMDPSDGGDWCQCERCAAMGSISDRALSLANEVAAAVNEKFDNKYVGMYAYNYHSPPPSIKVHPNVIISIATSFIKGGYTLDELISGWSGKGATIGMREYYAVFPWDHDLPGQARGSDLEYLRRTICDFYEKGARFISCESSDNWGANGLGYYVASRLLWDIDEADEVERIVDDFLSKAFGEAKEPMRRYYELIDGSKKPPLCEDLIGRMYRQLAASLRLADTPEVRARIRQLVLYTRYVELYYAYSRAEGASRQAAFERLIRHGYRMRETMMVHTKALYRDLVTRDKTVNIPEEAVWSVPEGKNPWKSSAAFGESEIADLIRDGIAGNLLRDFEDVSFSSDLVRADVLKFPAVDSICTSVTGRGIQTFYTWFDKPNTSVELKITGGLIAHYRNRGNARVDLWRVVKGGDGKTRDEKVCHAESAPDGVERVLTLTAKDVGLHKITVTDGDDMTSVEWNKGAPMTIISSMETPASLSGSWSLYFYVPRGTSVVGVYAEGAGRMLDASGREVFVFRSSEPGYYGIKVPNGEDAKVWKLDRCAGTKRLLTVPPCLAGEAAGLLLPREVIEAERQ